VVAVVVAVAVVIVVAAVAVTMIAVVVVVTVIAVVAATAAAGNPFRNNTFKKARQTVGLFYFPSNPNHKHLNNSQ
jgi:hypothetical protein